MIVDEAHERSEDGDFALMVHTSLYLYLYMYIYMRIWYLLYLVDYIYLYIQLEPCQYLARHRRIDHDDLGCMVHIHLFISLYLYML